MMRLVVLLLLFPLTAWRANDMRCPQKDSLLERDEWYQLGDILIGGITSQFMYDLQMLSFEEHPSHELFTYLLMVTKVYQHSLALAFAVNEINENPKILPNVTLGFHISDNYQDARMTCQNTLELLSKAQSFLPNYRCFSYKTMIAVVGGLEAEVSFHMAGILGLYKIPELTYGSFAPEDRDVMEFPSFYRMVPSETSQYREITQLLLHFGWTRVGLLVADDNSGEHFVQELEALLSQKMDSV